MISYLTEICPSCGNPRSVCSDPNVPLYPQRSVCYVTAIKELAARQLRKKYPKEPGPELHPLDGISIWASPHDLTPDDDFLGTEQMEADARHGDDGSKESE